jgi:LysM repeat protein
VITSAGDTIYSLAQRYKTSADSLSTANCLLSADVPAGFALYVPPVPTVTVIPCGPPSGWARNHVVQPGDNLYRIALSYGITYPQLQRANCMGGSTIIYSGQRLWVPNIPTRTVPGVTVIPEFPHRDPTLPTSRFHPLTLLPLYTYGNLQLPLPRRHPYRRPYRPVLRRHLRHHNVMRKSIHITLLAGFLLAGCGGSRRRR